MKIEISAVKREAQGTGASRRLRRDGRVPGIVYGGGESPEMIELDHNELYQGLRKEAFHSSILTLKLGGQEQQVLLRALNMHPFRKQVQHIDFLRVRADQEIHTKVPLHFMGQESSPAIKLSAAVISHVMNELDVSCLPADLPGYIEVDLSTISLGDTIHVRDIPMPTGVKIALAADENPVVVTTSIPKEIAVEEVAVDAAADVPASEVPAAKQAEAPDASDEESKKDKGEKK